MSALLLLCLTPHLVGLNLRCSQQPTADIRPNRRQGIASHEQAQMPTRRNHRFDLAAAGVHESLRGE